MAKIQSFLRSIPLFFIVKIIALVAVAAVIVAMLYAYMSPLRISADIAKAKIQKGEFDVILDVRTQWERDNLGYRRGSAHIPSGDIEGQFPKLYPDKETRILAYCNSGQRARRAAEKLQAMGYKHVNYIMGGYTSIE